MVSAGTVIAVSILLGFGAIGGASLVKPAIKNAKSSKTSLVNKINETKQKLKEGSQSG